MFIKISMKHVSNLSEMVLLYEPQPLANDDVTQLLKFVYRAIKRYQETPRVFAIVHIYSNSSFTEIIITIAEEIVRWRSISNSLFVVDARGRLHKFSDLRTIAQFFTIHPNFGERLWLLARSLEKRQEYSSRLSRSSSFEFRNRERGISCDMQIFAVSSPFRIKQTHIRCYY